MDHKIFPKPKTLIKVWLVLMGLTITTMIAGKVTSVASIGIIWMAVLMVVTVVKASLILDFYLDLKSAKGGWNKGFLSLLLVIVVIIFGLYVAQVLTS